MNSPSDKVLELFDVLHSISEGSSADDLRRLEDLIRDDRRLRRLYVIYMHWHAQCERYSVLDDFDVDADVELTAAGSVTKDEHDRRRVNGNEAAIRELVDACDAIDDCCGDSLPSPGTIAAPLKRGTNPIRWYSRRSFALFTTCAALLIAVGIVFAPRFMTLIEGDSDSKIAAAGGESIAEAIGHREIIAHALADEHLAVLTKSMNCKWGDSSLATAPGSRLGRGWLRLESGVAEVTYTDGARVILQGPAHYSIESAQHGVLHSGRLIARVPQQAIGFTVRTATTEIIDLGTEFGVVAEEAGATEVHVFDGAVDVQPRGRGAGPVYKERLVAGQAKRIEPPSAERPPAAEELDRPWGMLFSPQGELYVADTFADAIHRFDVAKGTSMGTFVPQQTGNLNTPVFMAWGADGHLYVSSSGNHSVLCFDGLTGEFLSAFVPPRTADLAQPTGLAFGRGGDLFVASVGKKTVFRFDGRTGEPLGAVLPSGDGGLTQPMGLVFNPISESLWLVDTAGDQVLQIDVDSGRVAQSIGNLDDMQFPIGAAFDEKGTLFVACRNSHKIVRIREPDDPSRRRVDAFDCRAWPHGIAVGPDKRLYVSCETGILRYDSETGRYLDTFAFRARSVPLDRDGFVRRIPTRPTANTGVSHRGVLLEPGDHDRHWIVSASADPRFLAHGPAIVTAPAAGWEPNGDSASWISVAPTQDGEQLRAGTYAYMTMFDLDEFHPAAKSCLRIDLLSPHPVVDVLINSKSTGLTFEPNVTGEPRRLFIESGIVEGPNWLEFVVEQAEDGPTGLRVELKLTTPDDEN